MSTKSFSPGKLRSRIKIKDLPADKKISKEEMKQITGGKVLDPSQLFSTKGVSLIDQMSAGVPTPMFGIRAQPPLEVSY